jgi:two-component sensor histidine kinase
MTDGAAVRVLSVDDTPDDRALVRREVEGAYPAAEVTEVGTREGFEAVVANFRFDLVVTDLELKWGNGREVLERVRADHPDCPVIMFTDSGDEMTAVELMKAGLDDYVVKSARQLPRLRASIRIAIEGARNRTALTRRERELAALLEHERTIVRELHHRVKNNLQTITALLQLRARSVGGEAAGHLDELAGRMRALAAVQARIYEADALDRVDLAGALADMASDLAGIYGEGSVKVDTRIDSPLELEVARAMPLALLAYEVMLNAFKHAWPDGARGVLTIALRQDGGRVELRVTDDGVGYQEGSRKGIGTRLARSLAREAGVEMETISSPGEGTAVVVRFS